MILIFNSIMSFCYYHFLFKSLFNNRDPPLQQQQQQQQKRNIAFTFCEKVRLTH